MEQIIARDGNLKTNVKKIHACFWIMSSESWKRWFAAIDLKVGSANLCRHGVLGGPFLAMTKFQAWKFPEDSTFSWFLSLLLLDFAFYLHHRASHSRYLSFSLYKVGYDVRNEWYEHLDTCDSWRNDQCSLCISLESQSNVENIQFGFKYFPSFLRTRMHALEWRKYNFLLITLFLTKKGQGTVAWMSFLLVLCRFQPPLDIPQAPPHMQPTPSPHRFPTGRLGTSFLHSTLLFLPFFPSNG